MRNDFPSAGDPLGLGVVGDRAAADTCARCDADIAHGVLCEGCHESVTRCGGLR